MLNFNPESVVEAGPENRIDVEGIKRNWRSLERHLDFALINVFIDVNDGDTSAALALVGLFVSVVFPTAANFAIFFTLLRPVHWISGNLKFTVYWCGSVADNTKVWELELASIA